MSSYTIEERRAFLQLYVHLVTKSSRLMTSITGAPKLPIGGFRGLTPPFTVVRKPHEPPFKADDYLPSVMTCAQVRPRSFSSPLPTRAPTLHLRFALNLLFSEGITSKDSRC